MKTGYKISILINFASVCVVIFLLVEKWKSSSPIAAVPEIATAEIISQPRPQATPITDPKPFHWAELESSDYQTYIANLRRIECPEQTIRDIITADVDAALFASRREQLKQNQNGELAAELQELNNSESALIASLLGIQPDIAVAATAAHSRSVRKRSQITPVAMPIVFANLDSAELKLNASQLREIAQLRESFVNQLGGTNQDPKDPAYRARWQKAQPAINAELEAMLGTAAYQQLQFESQSAASSSPDTAKKP